MKSINAGATWFIPCSTMQANSARYALAMIKRVASAPGFLNDLPSRKESLSNQIFAAVMQDDGQLSHYRASNPVKYALGFNFTGHYVSDHRGEGLILSFFMPDKAGSAYTFSPLSAAVFTQAVLDVCGLDEEVEITYSYLQDAGDIKSGCFSITKAYLEHFPIEQLAPSSAPVNDEHYYALCLKEPHPCLPKLVSFSLDAKKSAYTFDSDCHADIPQSVVANNHLYSLKKLSYFEYNIIARSNHH
ncbi:hypothetical protein [Serratia symbiotica]|uniref:hypothetical protein n=1 Tax=Serratia symbiotica TaxID=138074 RepID=UPI001323DD51|nr:hypothetical protein [Serratia symbiotica]QTP13401.1 hypothetical protein GPZ83_0000235 [Serratia symbiotica]